MLGRVRLFCGVLIGFSLLAASLPLPHASAEILYYTSGSSVLTWDSSTGVHSAVSNYTGSLGRIAFSPSGMLFALNSNNDIVRLAPDGSWSTVVTDIANPGVLAAYGETLYVKRTPTSGITRVDQSGNYIDWASLPEYISGLACDTYGNIFATGETKVFKVDPGGTVATFADFAQVAGANQLLTGIARAEDGMMYVTSQNMNSPGWGYGAVWSLTPQGTWTPLGGHPDGLYGARQIATSSSGQVYVLHTWSPFAGSSQISLVPNGDDIGYSGFQVGGIAFKSAAVPEPSGWSLLAVGISLSSAVLFARQSRTRRSRTSMWMVATPADG